MIKKRASKQLHPKDVDRLISTCSDSIRDKRDAALILLLHESKERIHTLRWFTVEDFERERYKFSQRLDNAISSLINTTGITSGPLFRSSKENYSINQAVSQLTIFRIIHERLQKAGMKTKNFNTFSLNKRSQD